MEKFNPEALGQLAGIVLLVIAGIFVLLAQKRKAKRKKEEGEIE